MVREGRRRTRRDGPFRLPIVTGGLFVQTRFTLDPEQFLHRGRANVDDVVHVADLFQVSRRSSVQRSALEEVKNLLAKQLSALFERDTASGEVQVRLVFILICRRRG